MAYKFDEAKYQFAKNNYKRVAWNDFKDGRKDFPDYNCIANPYLIKGSDEHLFWKRIFDDLFETNCYFSLIVRVINSFMITGENAIKTC